MNIVIAGGGKLGYYLAKTLISYRHKVLIIEPEKRLCIKLANELNIPVHQGDGTDIEDLYAANIKNTDIFIAVTGRDEDNLIACQLAKKNFCVPRTITRVNNPKNIEVFERLGVDMAVSSTAIIADLIEQEVDFADVRTIMKLKKGRIVVSEINILPDTPIVNKPLKDLDIPKGCILISIIRDEEVIVPNGFTVLHSGDHVIAVTSGISQQELKDYFLTGKK